MSGPLAGALRAAVPGRRHLTGLRSDSLVRNALFLTASTLIVSAFGFLFWTITARLFRDDQVGAATTLVATGNTVALLAGLGLNRCIVRFLGRSEHTSATLATQIAIVATTTAVVSAAAMVVLPLAGVVDVSTGLVVLFVIAGVAASVKGVLDSAFVALRATGNSLAGNVVGGITRLAIPFAVVSLGVTGIYVSYALSLVAATALCGYLLATRLAHDWRARPRLERMTGMWRFSLGSYLSDIIGGIPAMVLPIIVAARIGLEQAAYWYMAMMIATLVFTICAAVSQSLLAEISHDPSAFGTLTRRGARLTLVGVLPCVVVLGAFAPLILHVFGQNYGQATDALRLLLASSLLVAGNYIAGTVLNFYKRVGYLAFANAVNAVIVIVLALTIVDSLTSLGVAWLIGEIVNLALFAAGAIVVTRAERHRRADGMTR